MSMKRIKNKTVHCTDCKKEAPALLLLTIPFEFRRFTNKEEIAFQDMNKINDVAGLKKLKKSIRSKICPQCTSKRIKKVKNKLKINTSGALQSYILSAPFIEQHSKRGLF